MPRKSQQENTKLKNTHYYRRVEKQRKREEAEEEYEVEKIMGKRYNVEISAVEYLVKWKHYPHSVNSWLTLGCLDGCKEMLAAFEAKRKPKRVDEAVLGAPVYYPRKKETAAASSSSAASATATASNDHASSSSRESVRSESVNSTVNDVDDEAASLRSAIGSSKNAASSSKAKMASASATKFEMTTAKSSATSTTSAATTSQATLATANSKPAATSSITVKPASAKSSLLSWLGTSMAKSQSASTASLAPSKVSGNVKSVALTGNTATGQASLKPVNAISKSKPESTTTTTEIANYTMLTPRKDPLTRLSMDAIAAREASIHLEILNSVIAKVVAERKGTSPATNHASPTVKHVVKRSVSPEDTIANVSADFWERAKKRVKSLVSNVREPRPAKNIDDDDHDFKKSNKSGRDSADDTSYDEFDEDDIDISEATHVPKEGRRAAAKVALAANARLAKLKLKHDQKRGQHTIRKTLTPEPKEIKKPLVRRLPSPPRLISFPDIRWEPTVDQTERWRPLFPEKGLTYELHVINDFDESGPPGDFHFISEHILPRGDLLKIDPDFLVGCDCGRRVASTVDGAVAVVPCSEGAPCDCHSETAGLCPYDNEGRMALPSGTVITECNMNCACSIDTCKTRVVERGSTCKFLIFRTSNGRGWGVRTVGFIRRGTFVMDYIGEVISNDEAERRGKVYDKIGRTYLFDMDHNFDDDSDDTLFVIDAFHYGNVSHFFNHSCDPNLETFVVNGHYSHPRVYNICFFATRDIYPGEELVFDYAGGSPQLPNTKGYKVTTCLCGSRHCRGNLVM